MLTHNEGVDTQLFRHSASNLSNGSAS